MICKCDACDDPPFMRELTRCPVCQVLFCGKCWLTHYADRVQRRDGSLCHQIERAAWDNARMRRAPEEYDQWIPDDAEHLLPVGACPPDDAFPPEEDDWITARNHYLHDLRRQRC